MSFAALNPNNRASYYAMLLVVSNSSLYDKDTTSLEGEIMTIPTPDPSLEHEPSKKHFPEEYQRQRYPLLTLFMDN
jgi:hypothetical protein